MRFPDFGEHCSFIARRKVGSEKQAVPAIVDAEPEVGGALQHVATLVLVDRRMAITI